MAKESEAIKKRLAAAKKICENVEFYSVCECCESVVIRDSVFCPVCDGYRFDNSPDRIRTTVNILARRERTSVLPFDLF